MKSIVLSTLATSMLVAAAAVPASALPSAPKAPGVERSDIVPVAQGCGRGRHWSYRWRRCVRNW